MSKLIVSLSHDVDRTLKTYQSITHSLKSLKKGRLRDAAFHLVTFYDKDIYWNFEDIIEIENQFEVKSTFFFLNETIEFNLFNIKNWKLSLGRYNIFDARVIRIIKWLHENGWEIGVHGSYESYNDLDLLINEKKTLEGIIESEIIGIRQHYLNMNESTWSLQDKAGFLYDSSFGYTKEIGFKNEQNTPFFPIKNSSFLVIPMVIMDDPFVKTDNKWVKLEELVNISIKNNAVLVINWHSNNYNEREYPNFKDDYIKIIKKLKEFGAEFKTLKEVYKSYLP